MKLMNTFVRTLIAVSLYLGANLAWGQWELDAGRSSLAFVSTKNALVAEVSQFNALSGHIDAGGAAQVQIHLDSVDTRIAVRDERMKESLFETARFPLATVSTAVDPAMLAVNKEGAITRTDITVTLALHGKEQTLSVPVLVVAEGDGRLRVLSAQPVIVNVNDFDLGKGVAALQQIAGLLSISTAVPVTFNLAFAAANR